MIVMTKVLADSVRDVPYKDQNRIPTPDPIDQTNKRAKDLRTSQGRALVVWCSLVVPRYLLSSTTQPGGRCALYM